MPFPLLAAAAAAAISPLGVWLTPVDGGTIRIEACGNAICGYVADSRRLEAHPDARDVKNKDASLRNRPIKGLLTLKLAEKAPGVWSDGFVYNPDDGGTYKGTAKLSADGKLHLQGCIVAPLCKTQVWTRVS